VNAAGAGFRAERKKKIVRRSIFLNHDHNMLEACEPRFSKSHSEPEQRECVRDAGLHAAPVICLQRRSPEVARPTWDIKYGKDWMEAKKVWSDTLDWIASGRSTPD